MVKAAQWKRKKIPKRAHQLVKNGITLDQEMEPVSDAGNGNLWLLILVVTAIQGLDNRYLCLSLKKWVCLVNAPDSSGVVHTTLLTARMTKLNSNTTMIPGAKIATELKERLKWIPNQDK